MEFKKILFFAILMHMHSVVCMFRARCTPLSSTQREKMKETLYNVIDKANKSLFVSIFTFVDKEVARKLALAKARGVKVKVIMDSSSDRGTYGVKDLLDELDVPTLVYKASEGINHNKYIIADQKISLISSMNFTNPAYLKNRESSLLAYSKAIASYFIKDFNETCQVIRQQEKKEIEKKMIFERRLALERKKHEESMRDWRESQRKRL